MPRALTRLLRGDDRRPTRLHTEAGEPLPLRHAWQIPVVLAQRVTPDPGARPWWPLTAIAHLHQHLPRTGRVIEFGAGGSTVWLARRAETLVSLETDPAWHAAVQQRLAGRGLDNAAVHLVDDAAALPDDGPVAAAIIDGYERARCLAAVLPRLQPGGLIYLDDADADKDADPAAPRMAQTLLKRAAETWPDARLTRLPGMIRGTLHAGESWSLG